jgi:hypothetical protein
MDIAIQFRMMTASHIFLTSRRSLSYSKCLRYVPIMPNPVAPPTPVSSHRFLMPIASCFSHDVAAENSAIQPQLPEISELFCGGNGAGKDLRSVCRLSGGTVWKGEGWKRHKVTKVHRNTAFVGELCYLRGRFPFTANCPPRSSRAKSRDVEQAKVSRLRSTRTG